MINTIITKKEECTNCKACYNVCPNKAIDFFKDEYGFEYPYIMSEKCTNCGLCKNICSRIKKIESKDPIGVYAVQSKDWNISRKSSSGGMFAQIANYILSQNGVVFGCTMEKENKDFVVKHICITNCENLYKLQGSKYVQSDVNDCYIQAKTFLENGQRVLFSGTPCQIAGLKSFLKKDYNNLICVDLSCEGVPNVQLFNDYIKLVEKKYRKPVLDFKFRDKNYCGWNTGKVVVVVGSEANKKIKIVPKYKSSYFSLFIGCNILRESCYNCKFTGTKRVSDITIADAWGIGAEYPQLENSVLNFREGVSLVLVNTDNGKQIFEEISNNIRFCPIDINKLKKYNHPLRHPSVLTDNRETFLSLYKEKGYSAVDNLYKIRTAQKRLSLKDKVRKIIQYHKNKVDCLLMTMYANPNYGSVLATYSLYKTINDIGYSAKIIHYDDLKGFCRMFYEKYCELTDKVFTYSDYKDLNHLASTFILGSDNLINYKTSTFDYITKNLFNFSDITKKKLMISASMGDWDGKLDKWYEHNYFKALLKRFDYISTRENHGKSVIENVFGCNADWINDPVFYLTKNDYEALIKDVQTDYENSIMSYILYPTETTDNIVKHYEEKMALKATNFNGNENAAAYTGFEDDISIENWLSAIKNSKLIITDSFHCLAFALIFNKPVVCLENTHAPVRFLSLLERLGISIPIIKSIEDVKNVDLTYDKEKVNKEISNIREFAIKTMEIQLKKKHNCFNELPYICCCVIDKMKEIIQFLFSIENDYSNNKKHKILTVLGLKIKFKVTKRL